LPPDTRTPDFALHRAFRWRRRNHRGYFQPVLHLHQIRLHDLQGVERQKALVEQNTRQFVQELPANNVLLTGARGTGKSSLVKALLNLYAAEGLRLIEVEKHDLLDLPDIIEALAGQPFRFILFSDDLSFSADEPGYTSLKAVLDGSVSATPDNVLIYATSNRRHLMPEYMRENLETRYMGDEIHPGESVEEKISLSERFGLWVSFYPFDQDEYLSIVCYWLQQHGVQDGDGEDARREALQWALQRGSRSGRIASQFARDWAGRHGIGSRPP
jgi:predicted AAA+ superfamily ATPase